MVKLTQQIIRVTFDDVQVGDIVVTPKLKAVGYITELSNEGGRIKAMSICGQVNETQYEKHNGHILVIRPLFVKD